MDSKKNTIDKIFITDNLKLLFDINKRKDNLKKIDFCRETGINKNTVTTWINKNVIPASGNLKVITQYFNRCLKISLTEDRLLHKDLRQFLTGWGFNMVLQENIAQYLTIRELKLLERFRSMPEHKKSTIENLLTDFE